MSIDKVRYQTGGRNKWHPFRVNVSVHKVKQI